MNELALDPTETRQPRAAAPGTPPARRLGRVALAVTLGVAGVGAFAAASAFMSDLTGSRSAPVPPAAARQSAADWPDLMKDGLPALATGSLPAADAPRQIALPTAYAAPEAAPEAAPAPASAAASPEPAPATAPNAPVAAPTVEIPPKVAVAPKLAAAPAKPAPTIENAPVIASARQAGVLPPPSRTAPTVAARPAETVRARTASTSFAALPPAPDKAAAEKPAARPAPAESRKDPAKREEAKAEAAEPARKKPEKAVTARKPAQTAVASAEPAAPAEPEETEVFGIKVPTLAATGRKIGASVEALGDVVKGLPDKF
ncbi:hypothetical protein [Methylobacterium radiodurans]|uniref:Uncharacterized protein n=1 Tax=Methylobacterium radiodurans TaxID=2202828 RepID=A0A2U8VPK6_9HYPH|nr:hypothetical protein [Methylobacterium radiodurans]AWN35361.1 hypothetical protein DK427_06115 [Methylobacterium radiodurans]